MQSLFLLPIQHKPGFLLLLFLFFGLSTMAQDDGDYVERKLVRVTKNDGATYVGYLDFMDEDKVIIETENLGMVSIPKHTIADIEYLESDSSAQKLKGLNKRVLDGDPRNTRYLVSSSAIPLQRGSFLANFNLWGPQFTYAATDNLSFGITTSWLTVPVVFNGKYTFQLAEKAHMAVGANFGVPSVLSYDVSVIDPFATLTFGTSADNISVSYHYYAGLGDLSGGYVNAIVIGGRKTISKKYAFLFDSFFLGDPASTSGAMVIAPGFRYTYSAHSAFQFGLTGVVSYNSGSYESLPIPIPFVAWTILL